MFKRKPKSNLKTRFVGFLKKVFGKKKITSTKSLQPEKQHNFAKPSKESLPKQIKTGYITDPALIEYYRLMKLRLDRRKPKRKIKKPKIVKEKECKG